MPVLAMLLAMQSPVSLKAAAPPCRAAQLRLSVDGRDGDFNGMSHSGTEVSIRNLGPDCMVPALPVVQFRDVRGRILPVVRQVPRGMHPGPVMVPVRLAGGHRAATDLRWVSGPVFTASRSVQAAGIVVKWGGAVLRAPLVATLYGETGRPVTFDQPPLHAVEGMAAG